MDKDSLTGIIKKCKKGDKSAFKQLMMNYIDYVFILGFRILNNEEDARDIVQETFIRVWQNMEKYREEIKITTWIYKITTNLCLDKLKSRKRRPIIYEAEFEKAYYSLLTENLSEQIDNKQLADIIYKLSENLTPKQKLIFVLTDLQDFDNDEIKEITGMSSGQIKSNLYYARQQIRNSLIQEGYDMR